MSGDKKKSFFTALTVWLFIFGIIIVAFALNINKIREVLHQTSFVESIFGSKKNNADQDLLPKTRPDDVQPTITEGTDTNKLQPIAPDQIAQESDDLTSVSTTADTEGQDNQTEPKSQGIKNNSNSAVETQPAPQEIIPEGTKTQYAKLYFVLIDNDGRIVRKEVNRLVPQNDAPLTTSLKTLIKGPVSDEVHKGFVSLIPSDSSLISASVQNGVAYLNFNDAFQFNKYGIEGYMGQLMQVVYTATEYSTVTSVQILIDGQRRDYLGSEGVWIGTPLSRASFK